MLEKRRHEYQVEEKIHKENFESKMYEIVSNFMIFADIFELGDGPEPKQSPSGGSAEGRVNELLLPYQPRDKTRSAVTHFSKSQLDAVQNVHQEVEEKNEFLIFDDKT